MSLTRRRTFKVNNTFPYVDLGLPSGRLWAAWNVGAESEYDYGNQFLFGNPNPATASNCSQYSDTYSPATDPARQNMGEPWRLPTEAEMQELVDNTTHTFTSVKNRNGMRFTSKTNGNSIFLPATGYTTRQNLEADTGWVGERGKRGYYWSQEHRNMQFKNTNEVWITENSDTSINVYHVRAVR